MTFVALGSWQVVNGQIPWEANVLIVSPLLGLLLPYRKFFPQKQT